MKVIVAGSRTIIDYSLCKFMVKHSGFQISEIVCGGAKGVDSLGSRWANYHEIPVKYFRPDWDKYGKSAGPLRNKQMAEYADALILLWDGKSRGSSSMLTAWKDVHGTSNLYQLITV